MPNLNPTELLRHFLHFGYVLRNSNKMAMGDGSYTAPYLDGDDLSNLVRGLYEVFVCGQSGLT